VSDESLNDIETSVEGRFLDEFLVGGDHVSETADGETVRFVCADGDIDFGEPETFGYVAGTFESA
jgi:hypothetical protein